MYEKNRTVLLSLLILAVLAFVGGGIFYLHWNATSRQCADFSDWQTDVPYRCTK